MQMIPACHGQVCWVWSVQSRPLPPQVALLSVVPTQVLWMDKPPSQRRLVSEQRHLSAPRKGELSWCI